MIILLLFYGGVLPAFATPSRAEARLLEGLLTCAEAVDLSDCGLSAASLGKVYADLLYGHPELFHVALRLSFSARGAGEGRMVAEVYPTYTMTGEVLAAARTLYRSRITEILADMDAAFGERKPTEGEIVLYLHDYLADHYAYDTRAAGANADVHSFFRDGVGICQAYALAFMALARGAGLEADFVASAAMDHAWNHVRVDGIWYHVDVTRDDPIPARGGSEEVNHARLLRSDEGMAALGYGGFSCAAGHVCSDERFESEGEAPLGEFHGALVPFPDGWMGTDEDGAPVAVSVGADGFSTGQRGDVDGDERITPADLLKLCGGGEGEFEDWRRWIREELVRGES